MTSTDPDDLRHMSKAVNRARADVVIARGTRQRPGLPSAADEQRRLLFALESYTAALTGVGYPIPHRLHNELAMYRAMFEIRRSTP